MTITKLNYEVYALDYLEGTLSKEMQVAMEQFLKSHPAIAMELEEMREVTPLSPDFAITYKHKEKLLKKESKPKVIWMFNWRVGIAAAVTLLIGVFSLLQIESLIVADEKVAVDHTSQADKEKIHNAPTSVDSPVKLPEGLISQTPIQANKPEVEKHSKINNSNSKELESIASASAVGTVLPKLKSRVNVNNKDPFSSVSDREKVASANIVLENKKIAESPLSREQTNKQITRPIEVAATLPEFVEKTEHPNRTVVAALLFSEIKEIDGSTDFKNLPIKRITYNQNKELLAENTPKKRTLKSMLGKLPGDRISVSILPSFFTDKGD